MPKNKLIYLYFLFFFCFLVFLPLVAGAVVKIEIPLPGLPEGSVVGGPAQYIRSFFIFGLSLIGFIAVVALIIGGIQYMLSGTVTSVEKSKKTIFAALQGVVLLICAALLLSLIDPSLTNLAPSKIEPLRAEQFEPPSPSDNGMTAGSVASVAGEIKCSTTVICDDIKNGKLNPTLVDILGSAGTVVTETTGSHGCLPGDKCAGGAACGTSNHCNGTAVDLRTKDLSAAEKQALIERLANHKCTNELFYSEYPQYCRVSGQQAKTGTGSSCAKHDDHIHYSVKPNCS